MKFLCGQKQQSRFRKRIRLCVWHQVLKNLERMRTLAKRRLRFLYIKDATANRTITIASYFRMLYVAFVQLLHCLPTGRRHTHRLLRSWLSYEIGSLSWHRSSFTHFRLTASEIENIGMGSKLRTIRSFCLFQFLFHTSYKRRSCSV